MKPLFIFFSFLLANFGWSQPSVDILLVNYNIGYPVFNGFQSTNSSSDLGLNQIFQNHNVYSYDQKGGHPYPDNSNRITEVLCQCDHEALVNELIQYSSVVADARVSRLGIFSDALIVNIVNPAIGIPSGANNTIAITNDTGLNQIYEEFNVFFYEQAFPTSQNQNLLEYYWVVCDCDNVELKSALETYTSVIESVEFVRGSYLLDIPAFEVNKTKVYPNPFINTINTDNEELIATYSLFDLTGKEIITTDSKMVFDTKTTSLQSGSYLLKLIQKDGNKAFRKIIKK